MFHDKISMKSSKIPLVDENNRSNVTFTNYWKYLSDIMNLTHNLWFLVNDLGAFCYPSRNFTYLLFNIPCSLISIGYLLNHGFPVGEFIYSFCLNI